MKISLEKNINLSFENPQSGKSIISADYDKIYESVYNIVDNAIKYTGEGGCVTVRTKTEGGSCVIEIEDNGPGIPDDEKTKIFDRFYRLDDSRARDTGGTGLGLAISREAILMHNGNIEVTDAPEKGSIFIITLPIRKAEKAI